MKHLKLTVACLFIATMAMAQSNQSNERHVKMRPHNYYATLESNAFASQNEANHQNQSPIGTPATGGQRAIDTVGLGSSGNLYTILQPACNRVAANNDINTVAFIHRTNGILYPNDDANNGQYRYDVSTDGGKSFTNDYGLLNPSGNQNTAAARYPNNAIHNPIGNTNAANGHMTYLGTWHAGGNWDGYFGGAGRLDGDSTTYTENIYNFNSNDVLIARAMCNGAQGVFWAVDWAFDNTNLTGGILVYKDRKSVV